MPRLYELLLSDEAGAAQHADAVNGIEASSCDSTDVRLHIEFGSKKTRRSRRQRMAICMVSGPTWMSLSAGESLPRFVAEPNHITSVFFMLS
jgi:hypothetical protein